jgi:hypothetical protein
MIIPNYGLNVKQKVKQNYIEEAIAEGAEWKEVLTPPIAGGKGRTVAPEGLIIYSWNFSCSHPRHLIEWDSVPCTPPMLGTVYTSRGPSCS